MMISENELMMKALDNYQMFAKKIEKLKVRTIWDNGQ
jgi:hypothetical protein